MREALGAGAAGAADTVDVVLDVPREVIVDHGLVRGRGRGRSRVRLGVRWLGLATPNPIPNRANLDVLDIDPARGDVGGDHDGTLARLEVAEHLLRVRARG